MSKSLKVIASLKALRGCIAFGVGVALVLISHNSKTLTWTEYPTIKTISENDPFLQQLVEYFSKFPQEHILNIGLLTVALGIFRWIEAGGIWENRSWAQWIAVLTGFIYIPFEIDLLVSKFNWMVALILTINLLIVIYLLYVLYRKKNSVY